MKLNLRFFYFIILVIAGSALMNLALTIPTIKAAKDEEVSLKEYFETRINALEKNIEIQFTNVDNKLTGLNQSLGGIATDVSKLATKAESENNRANIQDLRESRANQEGKASMGSVYFAYGLSVIGIGIAALSLRRRTARRTAK